MARSTHRMRRGFTLAETATASIVLGLLAGATLSAVSAAASTWKTASNRARGRQLAGELLAEVCSQLYKEPGSIVLGPDAGEVNAGVRTAFDDIDDFDGLTEAPLRDRYGTDVPGSAGWRRMTTVKWVSSSDLSTASAAETSVKLVTVEVFKDNKKVGKATAIRTAAWDDALWTGRTLTTKATVLSVAPSGG